MWEGEKDRKQRLADKRKAELKNLREKLMTGTRDAVLASDNSCFPTFSLMLPKSHLRSKDSKYVKFSNRHDFSTLSLST